MIDIDWNAPKTPCKTEGCSWPNYHVCLVGKEDRTHEFPQLREPYIPGRKRRASTAGINGRATYMSDAHKESLRTAQNNIWADHHARNAERNAKIAADYKSGLSIREVRSKYGIGHGTTIKILHEARDRGEIVMRARGYLEYGVQKMKAV
jgi:hypothetical protein